MMIPSQKAFQVKLFEYSLTTVTKSSSNWADQRVCSNSFRHANFTDFCRAAIV